MKLTSAGRGVLIGGVALIAIGVTLKVSVALGVGAAALVLVIMATTIVSEAPRVRLERTAFPSDVERGAPAQVQLRFFSTSARRPRPFAVIEQVEHQRRIALVPAINPGDSFTIEYPVDTKHRGVIDSGPMVVRRSDPFGLISADRAIGGTCSIRVRPRRHMIRMLPTGRQRDLEGPTRERSDGSNSFHQLREYVPGDDLRMIHWRSSAKTGTLMVRQLVDTTRPEMVVIVDNRRSTIDPDSFEEAIEVAVSVLHAAESDGFPTQLFFADGEDATDIDGRPIPHIDRLTAVQLADENSLVNLAETLRSRGRSLIVVTGELSGPDLALIARISRGFEPAYLVSVSVDRTAPLVAPPGMKPVQCSSAIDFATQWRSVR